MKRRKSLPVQAGSVTIGGDAPVSVQTMSTVNPAHMAEAVVDARRLASYGAEILRFAVPDMEAAKGLAAVVQAVDIPIVADIHFDYRLALAAVDSGVQALRINPGNIGSDDNVVKVVEKVRPKGIPIRIGINTGSLPEDILAQSGGHPTAEGMVEGALRHIRILERMDYRNMVISLKSSDVPLMIEAYEALADKVPYALHLGVTEAGLVREEADERPGEGADVERPHEPADALRVRDPARGQVGGQQDVHPGIGRLEKVDGGDGPDGFPDPRRGHRQPWGPARGFRRALPLP